MSELLQPQYAVGFSCLGPDCADNCCHEWNVPIDKETYYHYRKCPDPILRAKLDKHVTRNRSNPGDNNYAKINMNSDRLCPLLDNQQMCSLQRAFGENYLSLVCHTYPRIFRKVNGVWEMALTLSCPEAARMALLNPDRMEFDFTANSHDRFQAGMEFNPSDDRFRNNLEEHFWPLRIFAITLLQNRAYALWQRLLILGFFCKTINTSKPKEIPSIIDLYNKAIEEGDFRGEMETIPTGYEVQGVLLKSLVTWRLNYSEATPKFVALYNKAKEAAGLADDDSFDFSGYKNAYESYYRPFMKNREHILENYLVNFVFKNIFPFNGKGVFDSYVMLVIHYAIIKLLLIGLAAHYKENFSEDHIIELVYSFARDIEHNESYLSKVHSLLVDNQLNNIAYMAILLRN